MANSPRGQTATPVIPGYWDATGNVFVEVSAATPFPVTVPAGTVIPTAPAVPARMVATQATPVVTPTAGASVLASSATSQGKVLKNISPGAQVIYIGQDATLTVANGLPLSPGDFLSLKGSEAVFAVSSASGGVLGILEEFSV